MAKAQTPHESTDERDHRKPPPADETQDQPADVDAAAVEIQRLRDELEETDAKYKRALADYQNFARRAAATEERARAAAIVEVVRDLLPALDHLDLALSQDVGGSEATRRLHEGVSMVRDELLRALGRHGAVRMEVQPGEEFDPARHEALMQEASDEIEPGRIVRQFQVGYALGEMVIRPVKVAIAQKPD